MVELRHAQMCANPPCQKYMGRGTLVIPVDPNDADLVGEGELRRPKTAPPDLDDDDLAALGIELEKPPVYCTDCWLFPEEVEKLIPKLYSTDGQKQTLCPLKFFFPCGAHTWYVFEGQRDGDGDFRFYGYVDVGNECSELGYFMLSELKSVKMFGGHLGVERDLWWTPTLLDKRTGKPVEQNSEAA